MQVINGQGPRGRSVVIQWSTQSPRVFNPNPVVYLFDDQNKVFYESKHLSELADAHQLVRENDTQLFLKRKFKDIR